MQQKSKDSVKQNANNASNASKQESETERLSVALPIGQENVSVLPKRTQPKSKK